MNPADEQPKPTAPVLGEWTPVRATAPDKPHRQPLSRTQKLLISVVITAAIAVAIIGFTGSYMAVSNLARTKGFGWFASIFPLGIDAGIVAVLALDMVLTGFRMRYTPLRPTAWLLTAATIAFNASAAWGDPLAVGMHAVIPFLFVIVVEAARHAVGIIANIEADRHMESPRLTRWILAFPSTLRIWRRQRLWELRSYEDVIAIERDAAQYREALRAEHGRHWRRNASADTLLALRLARYGTPIAETIRRLETERTAAAETAAQRDRALETAGTETAVDRSPDEPRPALCAETKQPETRPETGRETRETKPAETGLCSRAETKVSQVTPETRRRETKETSAVPIGDRGGDRDAEVELLVSLMETRGGDMKVSLDDAIRETGRPKSTAAKRLAAARDQYRRKPKTETA